MQVLFYTLFISLFSFSSPKHDFHSSLAEVNYNAKNQVFEVSLRVFTDDLENDLSRTNGGKKIMIDFAAKDKTVNPYIETYLRKHFYFLNKKGEKTTLQFVGRESDADGTTLYFEIPFKEAFKNIRLHNSVMVDLFDDQNNIVNLNYKENKRTLLFNRSTTQMTVTP